MSGDGTAAEVMTVIVCGEHRDHLCDADGPALYGGDDVPTTNDPKIGRGRGYTWGSVTCSKCGMTAMDLGLMRGL